MRRLLAITAVIAITGSMLALATGPAAADGFGGWGYFVDGGYTVDVQITGSGVGAGGSLRDPALSGVGTVSAPTPCGYENAGTQQQMEAALGGDKAQAQRQLNLSRGQLGDYGLTLAWGQGIVNNWGKQGTWYLPECDSESQGERDGFAAANPPMLVPPGGEPPQPKVDREFLEDVAIRAMTLPTPDIGFNPRASGPAQTFVNLTGGTWFWVTNQPVIPGSPNQPSFRPSLWRPWTSPASPWNVVDRWVTATAGLSTATVIATFQGTTFTTSGGAVDRDVECPDGGKPYSSDAPQSTCKLDYVRSSGLGTYAVHAVSRWSVEVSSWDGTALSMGTLPEANMPGWTSVKVGEIQTVNR